MYEVQELYKHRELLDRYITAESTTFQEPAVAYTGCAERRLFLTLTGFKLRHLLRRRWIQVNLFQW